jgi:hypothetical protein
VITETFEQTGQLTCGYICWAISELYKVILTSNLRMQRAGIKCHGMDPVFIKLMKQHVFYLTV